MIKKLRCFKLSEENKPRIRTFQVLKLADYYSLPVTKKAKPPNIIHNGKNNFNLSDDHLREFFTNRILCKGFPV